MNSETATEILKILQGDLSYDKVAQAKSKLNQCIAVNQLVDLLSQQWWKERDFVFEGYPCTYYEWPVDRTIGFSAPTLEPGSGTFASATNCSGMSNISAMNLVLVPTFNCQQFPDKSISDHLRESISDYFKMNKNTSLVAHVFVHLIRYAQTDEFGILLYKCKMTPCQNYVHPKKISPRPDIVDKCNQDLINFGIDF